MFVLARVGEGKMSVPAALVVFALLEIWWIACLAGIFHRAGVPFAFALVPVVRFWLLAKIGFGAGMGALPLLIPAYNILWMLKFDRALAAGFGMSRLFGTCMFFLPGVFYTWLAFGPGMACQRVDLRSARDRDARGYSGGGFVEGLYEGGRDGGPMADKKKADMEELKRKYERRHN